MKIFIITLLGLSALVSCKKKYTCECITTKEYDSSYQNGGTVDFSEPATTTRTIKEKKKEDAEASCKSGNKTGYEPGFYEQDQEPTIVTTTCTIS